MNVLQNRWGGSICESHSLLFLYFSSERIALHLNVCFLFIYFVWSSGTRNMCPGYFPISIWIFHILFKLLRKNPRRHQDPLTGWRIGSVLAQSICLQMYSVYLLASVTSKRAKPILSICPCRFLRDCRCMASTRFLLVATENITKGNLLPSKKT